MEKLSYFKLYLQNVLKGKKAKDREYINSKAEQAEEVFEEASRNGAEVNQAIELAIETLVSDIKE